MKEEALKLANWLENKSKLGWADNFGQELSEASAMIRRLVEELDKQWQQGFAQGRMAGRDDFIKSEIDTSQTKQSEPVAIVNKNCENNIQWYADDIKKLNGYFLFTRPQTKPLTNEEIDTIITNCGYQIEETVLGKFVDIEGINMYNIFKGFTKAIEERHGIK